MYLHTLICFIALSEAITGSCALRAKRAPFSWQVVDNQCPRQCSTSGCPEGRYCAMQTFSLRCVPQRAAGASCHKSAECLSGLCQDRKCATKCEVPLTVANCPANSFCEEGHSGNSCVKKYKIGTPCVNTVQCLQYCVNGTCSNNQCPGPGDATGCPEDHYCKCSGAQNICVHQGEDGDPCRHDEECLNYCRRLRCHSDECTEVFTYDDCPDDTFCNYFPSGNRCVPELDEGEKCFTDDQCFNNCVDGTCTIHQCLTPNSTDGCSTGRYCKVEEHGNSCVPQSSDGHVCSKDVECINNCVDGTCTINECPTPSSTAGCLTGRYCKAEGQGNRCVQKLSDGQMCYTDVECVNNCIEGECMSNECPTPNSTDGCSTYRYCKVEEHGNSCVWQFSEGHICSKDVECINNCVDGTCTINECPTPSSTDGCLTGRYCRVEGQGNRCVQQLNDGQMCDTDVQCINNCFEGECMSNECPTPNSTDGCPTGRYCKAEGQGNRCVQQLIDGHVCSKDVECMNYCMDGTCTSNECPTPNSTDGCSAYHYCKVEAHGNSCVWQVVDGLMCSKDVECVNNCIDGACTRNECPTPSSTDGCLAGSYCKAEGRVNRCVHQLSDGHDCSEDVECINSCTSGACSMYG